MSTGQQPGNQQDLAYYRQRFWELNVNRTERGEALYQPILLLSVIDLIAQGLIEDNNYIPITEELRTTFNKYRDILIVEQNISDDKKSRSSLSLPFFHLQNEEHQFWHLDYKTEYHESVKINKKKTNDKIRKSITQLKKYVNHAFIEEDLFNLIKDEESREKLVDTLVTRWFSSSEDRIESLLKANQSFHNSIQKEIKKLSKPGRSEKKPKFYFRKAAAREAIFGKAVVGIYDYKCAFCRLKVSNSLNQNIVDGAHIEPFVISFNNQINNGISLCKNHHWAFDKGWFSITNNYKIIVANDLQEESPHTREMQEFNGEDILLPDSRKYDPDQYYPSDNSLEWHRKKWRFQT
jgi:putative restriction endonuclease